MNIKIEKNVYRFFMVKNKMKSLCFFPKKTKHKYRLHRELFVKQCLSLKFLLKKKRTDQLLASWKQL